ncbi:hypothetical protein PTMSG1_07177 [Pyrenophora teres f. maculata]|nr:hypothetical protein PTMSG1_07177 [Pyrenophora teres f. maculata]
MSIAMSEDESGPSSQSDGELGTFNTKPSDEAASSSDSSSSDTEDSGDDKSTSKPRDTHMSSDEESDFKPLSSDEREQEDDLNDYPGVFDDFDSVAHGNSDREKSSRYAALRKTRRGRPRNLVAWQPTEDWSWYEERASANNWKGLKQTDILLGYNITSETFKAWPAKFEQFFKDTDR